MTMGLSLRDRINLTYAPALSAAAVLLLIAGGCSQQPGSRGQGHTARAILAMTTTGPRFESPQTTRRVNASDSQAHQREIQFTTPAGKPATGRSTTVRRLGLFGEFPGVGPIARSSPLDSQGNIRPVSFSTEGGDFDPDPDPTGQWLVYASTRHRETADLYIKRIDGTTVTQLTSDPADDRMPTFRPDGKAIAFASDRGGTWDLYLVGSNGDKLVQLTNDPTHEIHPSFSPDGLRFAYLSNKDSDDGLRWDLFVRSPTDSLPKLVARNIRRSEK
ncbi:MAG: DPP IV N-terminal domain-containing protein, partial [Phycisphaeraceae bacterium]|nr:DPP IV N-terminal domain-containing protein [Phycisphaeraceae bacterium]